MNEQAAPEHTTNQPHRDSNHTTQRTTQPTTHHATPDATSGSPAQPSNERPAKKQHSKKDPNEMLTAHEWLARVVDELGLPENIDRKTIKGILDLTAAVAHNRSRPAAPVTAFLIGLAAGQSAGPNASDAALLAAVEPLVAKITEQAR